MKRAAQFAIVLVTAPDLRTARRLARSALEQRLVACVNIIPRVESHFWWKDKMEKSAELLLLLKTNKDCLAALEKLLLSKHPYDTAEFVVLGPESGAARYLAWWGESLRQTPAARRP